ncbi:cupin domain-containing protein [Paradevosia shaoguanensis]|uniref:cupin domain-containing protein n=1 Tax=Paradevosia shaoguanensis TaxID=1335043 RepID=UPI001932CF67|nr:cupin domain-containing protein [Paradevosia shaoguanensis]
MRKSPPEAHWSKPRGMLPNSRFPLLVFRNGIPGGGEEAVRERLRANGWLNNWRYPGIYTYPHFHSTTHECLGVATGWMEVELFGRGGLRMRVSAGDVVVMPAGVSHMMTGQSDDIMMIGGYPEGRDWDNVQEDHLTEELRRAAAKRIMMLPIPAKDPVYGEPMREWIDAPSSVDADLNDFRDGLDAI